MTIRHTDRTGHPWTFEIDCTPVQGRMFERLLLCVRNIGSREELSLSYLANLESNTAFRDGMEHAVLSALREWRGTPTATPEPQPPTPARVSGTDNVNPSTVSDFTNGTEPADEREPYYWENF